MRYTADEKRVAIKVAQLYGVRESARATGIPIRTIYYWMDPWATQSDQMRREQAKVRRRKEAEAAEAAIEEAAMLRVKLAELQEEVATLEQQLEAARNTAQTLNDHIHNHYPFGKVLDLTGDTHA